MDLMGDYELEGDELDGDSVLGDDVLGMTLVGDGSSDEEIGAKVRRAIAKRRTPARRRPKPRWRNELAPGVPVPGYGVFPIPLTPQTGSGIFTAAIANIEYRTVAQIPFRGERLVANIARSATAGGSQVLCTNGVHIGIRPQIGVLGPMNLEDFQATAFGVRMVMQPATQGAEIRVFAFVQPALAGTQTIALSLQILGRVAT
jgi:hypothetical protein